VLPSNPVKLLYQKYGFSLVEVRMMRSLEPHYDLAFGSSEPVQQFKEGQSGERLSGFAAKLDQPKPAGRARTNPTAPTEMGR